MKYIVYCMGVDFYAHISSEPAKQDYEDYISYEKGEEMSALQEIAAMSPMLLDYIDFKDI